MDITKAIGDLAFIASLTAVMLTPRIVELLLILRRK